MFVRVLPNSTSTLWPIATQLISSHIFQVLANKYLLMSIIFQALSQVWVALGRWVLMSRPQLVVHKEGSNWIKKSGDSVKPIYFNFLDLKFKMRFYFKNIFFWFRWKNHFRNSMFDKTFGIAKKISLSHMCTHKHTPTHTCTHTFRYRYKHTHSLSLSPFAK